MEALGGDGSFATIAQRESVKGETPFGGTDAESFNPLAALPRGLNPYYRHLDNFRGISHLHIKPNQVPLDRETGQRGEELETHKKDRS